MKASKVNDNTIINNPQSVDIIVKELKSKYLNIWYETKADFPKLDKKYSLFVKIKKERELNKFTENLALLLQNMPEDEIDQEKWKKGIMDLIRDFGKETLEFDDSFMNIIFTDGYTKVTNEFIRSAKNFDSSINILDIFQAIRNVWIMNSIQILLGMDVEFSPSIFAYSMLYPYTDNYLDNNHFNHEDKQAFNNRFRKRLLGEKITPYNEIEEPIFKLVEIIEDQYPRPIYPQVYEALVSIHDAQEKSLIQQRVRTTPYEKDILGISFEKGGSSVLADGYLVNPVLTINETDFMFGYGVFLQLADDLQDVREDFENNHMTIYSQLCSKWPLDIPANKLFHFMNFILNSEDNFSSPNLKNLKRLISISCNLLIFEAIGKNSSMYTRKYIKIISQYSMFRFYYMKKFKKRLIKRYSKIDINNILKAI